MKKTPKFEFRSSRLAWCAILAGSLLAGCGGGGDGGRDPILGGGGTAVLIPAVSSVTPLSNATGVPVNTRVVTATFNKSMDAATITAANFSLACPGGTAVTGAVTYTATGNVATLTVPNNLPGNTTCTATVAAGVRDATGNALANPYVWSFRTGATPETVPPVVSSTIPLPNATGVPVNGRITASFSEAMNPLTIIAANFSLACPTGTAIAGAVEYTVAGNVLTFTPAANLPFNAACRATISTGVRDVAGNAMVAPYVWNFTTGAVPDTTAPQVDLTVPTRNQTNVGTNTLVTARFTEAMDPLTITQSGVYTVACPLGVPVNGVVSYAVNSRVATFTPNSALPAGIVCQAAITTGVKDLAGNAMLLPYNWNFTTGVAPDIILPTITLVVPADLATNVALNTAVSATFSEDMDPLTISAASFTLQDSIGTSLSGQVTYDALSRIGTFSPNAQLLNGNTYRATVTNGVRDLAGNAMANNRVWSFSTGTGIAPSTVSLGAAGTFGIMATSAITSTGGTQINGDVSLNPGTSQGIPPPQVNGTIHINDSVSVDARAALLAAYNQAKALPPGVTIAAGADLGALYPTGIPPGTYTSGSTMLVSTTLTLDAGGDPNAVWVFQIGSSLTTSANVLLSPGAQAKNVFWVPTMDATIGVGTIFHGTIIAGRDSTGQTGAVINGRILSGATTAGTIALDNNTVNVPAP